ncbi:hypothetical protein [Rhizobium leguminosarum]|uniref:hypothetical protein n=1 Tax=Rhizobium leguminosarum TaxID=384 RepID=UPI003F9850B3
MKLATIAVVLIATTANAQIATTPQHELPKDRTGTYLFASPQPRPGASSERPTLRVRFLAI